MKTEIEDVAISISSQFVADNDRFKMRDALDHMVGSAHLDVCTAFLDAYGISSIGSAAENGELRLLVGFDLSDMPVAQDVVSFQMAEEWKASGEDPVHRLADDESVKNAVRALQLPSFQAAKAALRTHSKLYVTQDVGVVGSSNLTRSGIEGQRELNLFQHEPEAVARLREWFALMWGEAKTQERADFKQELIKWLETTRLKRFAPFHPYAKAIFERYRHRFVSLAASASDVNLAVFQEEGRDTALSVLAELKCCIIADAVGLGKTYIALGAMQRRSKARPRNQRKILVICPAQLESVWERASRDQGIALITESMETLGNTSGSGFEARLRDLENYALVIVDEAHNFRNPNANRFQNLMEILQGGPQDKEVLLVTATPINNSIRDLFSLYRLMTRDRDDFFQTTNLRLRSLRDFFKQVEKMGVSTTDLLLETMVCRSRLDIRRRQDKGEVIVINEKEVRFPNRHMAALEYGLSISGNTVKYDELAATIESLTLGAYNVEQYSVSPDAQKNQTFLRLQTLFRILLLKRLESSVVSFISTAENLLRFSDKVVEALREGRRLTNDEYRKMQLDFTRQLEDDDEGDGSSYLEELKERDPNDYDIDRLAADVTADHQLLDPLIDKVRSLVGARDGKIARLKGELKKLLPDQKALIFTFYADTADYIFEQLTSDKDFMQAVGEVRIEEIVGGTKPAIKTRVVEDFAPLANNADRKPAHPIQVLISTDVLSEGQNLQDCGYLINYDLHFNPVRMIQRNGRIDRLFSPHEDITIANFFPEGGLEEQLKIVERLQKKIEQIQDNLPVDSSVIGETVRVFSLEELRRTKAGDVTVIDEIDSENPINRFHDMLNEVIKMLQDFGIEEVGKIPFGCQSNKKSTHRGIFVCVIAGKPEEHKNCWWLYYPFDKQTLDLFPEPVQEPSRIIDLIRSPKPPSEDQSVPDVSPRDIKWEIILDAKRRCREMLIAQARNEAQGQVWATGHINKKIKTFFAVRPDTLPGDISLRLGRYSLEKHKAEAEEMMRTAQESRNTTELVDWLDEKLPPITLASDNPETMPLEVVSYLELIPETEAVE
ncbi:MAG: hypothetical protein HYX78_05005 [Armatimonadetes bacterium]|nr:hypothetical protein [Armatimonadota bacterium]